MNDQATDEGPRGSVISAGEASRRYRALLKEYQAPGGLIEEFDYFLESVDASAAAKLPPPSEAADPAVCRDLRLGLNQLRSQLVDRAVSHAAPGIGQEAMAFLNIDATNHHEGLRAELERMEREIQAAGCPI